MDLISLHLNREEPSASDTEIRFQVAVIAGVTAVAISLGARFVFGAPLVPELLAQFLFSIAPIWMVEPAVALLGPFAKHLAFLGCVVGYMAALTGAAFAYLR